MGYLAVTQHPITMKREEYYCGKTKYRRLGDHAQNLVKIPHVAQAYRGRELQHDFRTRQGPQAEIFPIGYQGFNKKGTMVFIECQRHARFETMLTPV